MSKNKITFGVAFGAFTPKLNLEKDTWKNTVQTIESLGFSGIFIADHFIPAWDPIAAMAGIAAVTNKIDVGSMVCCVDYRHPVIHAKASATINLISNNRHVFGFGAGWMLEDYAQAGITFDKAVTRVRRLKEAIEIIIGMWTQEKTSYDGKYYTIKEIPQSVYELEYARPRLMIGGGGKMMLQLAGHYSDIVNINFRIPNSGVWDHRIVQDGSYHRLGEKVERVRESAGKIGRDPDSIQYGQFIATTRLEGDPMEQKKNLAKRFKTSLDSINDCTWIIADEPNDIVENCKRKYEDYGITHYIIDGGDFSSLKDLEYFSENVLKRLP